MTEKVTEVCRSEGGMEVLEAKLDVHVVRECVEGEREVERKYQENKERLKMASWRREEQQQSE